MVAKSAWDLAHALQREVAFSLCEKAGDLAHYQPTDELRKSVATINDISRQLSELDTSFRDSGFFHIWQDLAKILIIDGDFDYENAVKRVMSLAIVRFRIPIGGKYISALEPLLSFSTNIVYRIISANKEPIMEHPLGFNVQEAIQGFLSQKLEGRKAKLKEVKQNPNDMKALELGTAYAKDGKYKEAVVSLSCTATPKALALALEFFVPTFPGTDIFIVQCPFTDRRVELLTERVRSHKESGNYPRALDCVNQLPPNHPWRVVLFKKSGFPATLQEGDRELLLILKAALVQVQFARMAFKK